MTFGALVTFGMGFFLDERSGQVAARGSACGRPCELHHARAMPSGGPCRRGELRSTCDQARCSRSASTCKFLCCAPPVRNRGGGLGTLQRIPASSTRGIRTTMKPRPAINASNQQADEHQPGTIRGASSGMKHAINEWRAKDPIRTCNQTLCHPPREPRQVASALASPPRPRRPPGLPADRRPDRRPDR